MAPDCKCFFCNTTCEMHELPSKSYSCRYVCRYCGEYLLDPQDKRGLSSEIDDKFKIACILNERRLKELGGVALNEKTDMEDKVLDLPRISIKDLLDDFPIKASDILNRSLLNLSRLPERPYDAVRRDFTEAGNYLMLFTSDQQSSYGFLKELAEQGYIRFNMVKGGPQLNVFFRTTNFWDRVEDLKEEHTSHRTGKVMNLPQNQPIQARDIEDDLQYDVFISHASEDKDAVARPLAAALENAGLTVWYDEYSLKLGDRLRRTIEQGLRDSRYGIIILSHSFFAKEWPQSELDGLVALETDGRQRIIPIWHNITHQDVLHYSPILGDRLAISTGKGLDLIAKEVMKTVNSSSVSPHSVANVGQPTIVQAYASLGIHHPNNRTCCGKFLITNPGPRICNVMDISLLSDISLPDVNLVSLNKWPGKSVQDDHTQKLPISIPVDQPQWVFFRTEGVSDVFKGDLPEVLTMKISLDRLKKSINKVLKRKPDGHQYSGDCH